MLEVLEPVVRQLDETYDALRISLGQVRDDRLGWTPGSGAKTVAQIVQHIARANVRYALVIGPEFTLPDWTVLEPVLPRAALVARVDESQRIAVAILDGVTAEHLGDSRSDDWCPNCEEQVIQGPLDALWFAQQMVRHTAYHLGQVNLYLQLLEGQAS